MFPIFTVCENVFQSIFLSFVQMFFFKQLKRVRNKDK